MNVKQLRERWQPEHTESVDSQFLTASRTPKGIVFDSPFGLTDAGLLDYRGVALHQSIRYTHIQGADFSHATIRDYNIHEAELAQCLFERADLRELHLGSRRMTGCSFAGARMQKCILGGVFVDCDFTGVNLSKSVASGTRFERCNFTGARLGNVMWLSRCIFDHCVFDDLVLISGTVAGARFIGSAPANLELCITEHVQFVDVGGVGGARGLVD